MLISQIEDRIESPAENLLGHRHFPLRSLGNRPIMFTFLLSFKAELDIVGKPTKQSSDFNGKLTSDKAVDGSQDSLLNTNFKCSHTGIPHFPS